MTDFARFAATFFLLVGLISVIFEMGRQQGRWSERRRLSRQSRIAKQDQERFGITTILALKERPGPRKPAVAADRRSGRPGATSSGSRAS